MKPRETPRNPTVRGILKTRFSVAYNKYPVLYSLFYYIVIIKRYRGYGGVWGAREGCVNVRGKEGKVRGGGGIRDKCLFLN